MVEQSAPTAAERLRSLLIAESSLDVVVECRRLQLIGRHEVDPAGRVRLRVPAGSPLARALTGPDPVPALVEVTDVAAVAMRDRVRARASLAGMLARVDPPAADGGADTSAELTPASGELVERDGVTRVSAAEFAAAEPDVLASREAALLCHLVDTHADLVAWLARLVPADRLHGVRRVHPLRLDRHGVVLRLEFPGFDRDARLPFTAPVESVQDAPTRMLELLARARTCRRHAA